MLTIQNIATSYGKIPILNGVDLELQDHQILAIIGPNGAGKTTLLKTVSGLIRPDAGTITFDGQDITGKKAYEVIRYGITMVPEGRLIFPSMTVRENLEMGACTIADKKKVQDTIDFVFTVFPRLKEREKQLGGTMSGGEQQMLAIGRGLMSGPKLLILDEPSLGLAPIIVNEVYRTIQSIYSNSDISILLVEQNAKVAFKVSEYVYVMENGLFKMHGPKEEIASKDDIRKAYLGG